MMTPTDVVLLISYGVLWLVWVLSSFTAVLVWRVFHRRTGEPRRVAGKWERGFDG